MADYTTAYNGAAKDSAQSVLAGADYDVEFAALEVAIATKANKTGAPATTDNLAMLTATGDLADSLIETDGAGNITAGVTGNVTGNLTGNVTGDVTGNCTGSSGSTTGNAATVTTNANMTGDVTSVGNATTIPTGTITSDMIAANTIVAADIAASAIGTSELAAGAARFSSEIPLGTGASSWAVGLGGNQTIPRGVYVLYSGSDCDLEMKINGTWRVSSIFGTSTPAVQVVSDGSNFRVKDNRSVNPTVYYDETFD